MKRIIHSSLIEDFERTEDNNAPRTLRRKGDFFDFPGMTLDLYIMLSIMGKRKFVFLGHRHLQELTIASVSMQNIEFAL